MGDGICLCDNNGVYNTVQGKCLTSCGNGTSLKNGVCSCTDKTMVYDETTLTCVSCSNGINPLTGQCSGLSAGLSSGDWLTIIIGGAAAVVVVVAIVAVLLIRGCKGSSAPKSKKSD